MTSKSASGCQKVCHDIKGLFVMMSKSSFVISQKLVMKSNTRHDIKNKPGQQVNRFVMKSNTCYDVKKYDVKNMS